MTKKKPQGNKQPKAARPMGIMASFSTVSFKKDGAEVFSAKVTSGGCFGPDDISDVIDRGYFELNKAVKDGTVSSAALDFNSVSVGANNYDVTSKTANHVEASKVGKPSAHKP